MYVCNQFDFCIESRKALENVGFRFIALPNPADPILSLYQVVDETGAVVFVGSQEMFDDPNRWTRRTEREQQAILLLAHDAIYGQGWD